jgi:hypothetical protein
MATGTPRPSGPGLAGPGEGTRHTRAMSFEPQSDIKLHELQLDILKEQMGKLIGTGGKTIQNIQLQNPKCKIQTPPKEDQVSKIQKDEYKFVPVVLSGKDQDVFKMAKMVEDVVDVCLVCCYVWFTKENCELS